MSAERESNRPPKGYERVIRTEQDRELAADEIKVTSQASQSRYISYAIKLLEGDEESKALDTIRIRGMGNAIYNAINVGEIVKRRVAGLHQILELNSMPLTDKWQPKAGKEGEVFEKTRNVSTVVITLSTKALDKGHYGYQEPIPEDEVEKQDPEKRKREGTSGGRGGGRGGVSRGSRGRGGSRGGRGRGGRGSDTRDERSRSDERSPARGRGGRGRGRDEVRGSRGSRGRGGRSRTPPRRNNRGYDNRDDNRDYDRGYNNSGYRGDRRGDRYDDRPARRGGYDRYEQDDYERRPARRGGYDRYGDQEDRRDGGYGGPKHRGDGEGRRDRGYGNRGMAPRGRRDY